MNDGRGTERIRQMEEMERAVISQVNKFTANDSQPVQKPFLSITFPPGWDVLCAVWLSHCYKLEKCMIYCIMHPVTCCNFVLLSVRTLCQSAPLYL